MISNSPPAVEVTSDANVDDALKSRQPDTAAHGAARKQTDPALCEGVDGGDGGTTADGAPGELGATAHPTDTLHSAWGRSDNMVGVSDAPIVLTCGQRAKFTIFDHLSGVKDRKILAQASSFPHSQSAHTRPHFRHSAHRISIHSFHVFSFNCLHCLHRVLPWPKIVPRR
jgi:hypothetical protein